MLFQQYSKLKEGLALQSKQWELNMEKYFFNNFQLEIEGAAEPKTLEDLQKFLTDKTESQNNNKKEQDTENSLN